MWVQVGRLRWGRRGTYSGLLCVHGEQFGALRKSYHCGVVFPFIRIWLPCGRRSVEGIILAFFLTKHPHQRRSCMMNVGTWASKTRMSSMTHSHTQPSSSGIVQRIIIYTRVRCAHSPLTREVSLVIYFLLGSTYSYSGSPGVRGSIPGRNTPVTYTLTPGVSLQPNVHVLGPWEEPGAPGRTRKTCKLHIKRAELEPKESRGRPWRRRQLVAEVTKRDEPRSRSHPGSF